MWSSISLCRGITSRSSPNCGGSGGGCRSAQLRYCACMATIQIRDVSEEAYEAIRRRARAAGTSIQAYMKQAIERLASEPDDDELFADLEQFVAAHGIRLDIGAVLRDIDDGRK